MADEKLGMLKRILRKREFAVFLALLILCVFLAIRSPVFLTVLNTMNVLRQISAVGILVVGQTIVLIAGGLDLSVGSGIALTGAIMASLTLLGVPPVLVLLLTLIAGMLLYSINGFLVTRVRINPFIATLGMLSVYRGVTLLLSGGIPIRMVHESLEIIGKGFLFGIVPIPAVIMIIVAIIGHIFLKYTTYGRNFFAVGNSEIAARYSGIRTKNVVLMAYVTMGLLVAVSGMVSTATLSAAEPLAGQGRELDVIAAAVIGGVSLKGGEGSILGAILGAALMGVLRNGFILLSVPGYWQIVSVGVVIIFAVALDSLRTSGD